MSILKAILHRWNKTTRTYDTIHPETETSQITDFDTAVNGKINTHNSSGAAHSKLFNQCEKTSSLANDIVTKLAQTTAISAISALQTNSWFGQLLKLVLNASGMKYLIDTNGYICFGSFFGGLIIQWGTIGFNNNQTYCDWILPLSTSSLLKAFSSDYDSSTTSSTTINGVFVASCKTSYSTGSIIRFATTNSSMSGFWVIAICK